MVWHLSSHYQAVRELAAPAIHISVFIKREKMDLLWFLLVGLIAGWLASAIVGGGFGVIGDIVIGIVGAFLGGYLFRRFGWSAGGGMLGSIIVATVGAIVLLLLLRLVRRVR